MKYICHRQVLPEFRVCGERVIYTVRYEGGQKVDYTEEELKALLCDDNDEELPERKSEGVEDSLDGSDYSESSDESSDEFGSSEDETQDTQKQMSPPRGVHHTRCALMEKTLKVAEIVEGVVDPPIPLPPAISSVGELVTAAEAEAGGRCMFRKRTTEEVFARSGGHSADMEDRSYAMPVTLRAHYCLRGALIQANLLRKVAQNAPNQQRASSPETHGLDALHRDMMEAYLASEDGGGVELETHRAPRRALDLEGPKFVRRHAIASIP